MKFLSLLMVSLFLALPTYAAKKIEKLLEINDLKKDHLTLFMDDGEVVHIQSSDTKVIEKSREAFKNSYLIELIKTKTSENQADVLDDIKILPQTPIRLESFELPQTSTFSRKEFSLESRDPMEFANMTRFNSYAEAQNIMNTFKGNTRKESQCYNRAHVWTYEAFTEHQVNLGKVWIFFTLKYIREYNYKWWFHIAPTANVEGYTYVVDRGFTKIPYNLTNWKNIFIQSKQKCTTTTDYFEYKNNPENGHCYLIFSSQHFYQPFNLETLSHSGTPSNEYYTSDIRNAYRDAIINWDGRIPGVQSDGDLFIFSLGESVISRNGVIGRVVSLRGDELTVQYQNMRSPILQHKGEVGMRRGSAGGFNVGDNVVNRYGFKGQVIAVYMDGFLGVNYSSRRTYQLEHPSNLLR